MAKEPAKPNRPGKTRSSRWRTRAARSALAAGALAILAIAVPASSLVSPPALAQSSFGDTSLSYSGGVVYDDDLVPGRRADQSFLTDEQATGRTSRPSGEGFDRAPPRNSPDLIGPDGRLQGPLEGNDRSR